MNLQEFIDEIESISDETGQLVETGSMESQWGGDRWVETRSDNDKYKAKKFVLKSEWSTGGMSGGSCWNDAPATGYSTTTPPEELVILDAILERFNPTITFIQYKALTNALIKHKSRTVNEYYGNTTNYSSYVVDVEELFHYMTEREMLK